MFKFIRNLFSPQPVDSGASPEVETQAKAVVSAVLIKADGTRIDLGVLDSDATITKE